MQRTGFSIACIGFVTAFSIHSLAAASDAVAPLADPGAATETVPSRVPFRISTGYSKHPAVHEGQVAWYSKLWVLTSGETITLDFGTPVRWPKVSDSYVVGSDGASPAMTLYGYELATGSVTQVPGSAKFSATAFAVDGSRVVWQSFALHGSDIFLYDFSSGETLQLTADGRGASPDISGNYVVYNKRWSSFNVDVYLYNLATGQHTAIAGGPKHEFWPKIDGTRIVWQDQNGPDQPDIIMHDLSTGETTPINTSPGFQARPEISGDIVVWEDWQNANHDVYMYNVADGTTTRVVSTDSWDLTPNVSGNLIVWSQDRYASEPGIYGYLLNQAPTADAGLGGTAVMGEPFVLDGSNSSDPENRLVSYRWDLGDGSSAEGPVITHTYSAVGIYTVVLTVTDNGGLSDSDEATVRVLARPVARAGLDQTVLVTKPLSLDGSDSYDADGEIVSYHWDFGDGSTATGILAEHSYAHVSPDPYTVTLTVTDSDGLSNTDNILISVIGPSQAITRLIQDIENLVLEGELDTQDADKLKKMLTEAQDKYDLGFNRPAARKLHDFIDRLNSHINSGRIDASAAQDLISAATDIIDVIEG